MTLRVFAVVIAFIVGLLVAAASLFSAALIGGGIGGVYTDYHELKAFGLYGLAILSIMAPFAGWRWLLPKTFTTSAMVIVLVLGVATAVLFGWLLGQ